MNNKTCAVVVTYNRKTLLEQALTHLLQQTCPCDILVVDNASTDGTDELVKTFEDKRISYYNTGKNIGGAGGFNIGMRKAVEAGYKYVWVMDDDTFVQPDALEQFFIADKKLNGEYGWFSSKALWTDGSICEMNRQASIDRKAITDFSVDLIPARSGSFVSMFFRSTVIKEVGLPIKEFFIWADDLEYSLRISRRNKCYVVTNSVVVHAMGDNSLHTYATLPPERIPRMFYSTRNRFYIARKFGLRSFCGYFKRWIRDFIKIILFSKSHRLQRISVLIKGMWAGLFFHPRVEYLQINK